MAPRSSKKRAKPKGESKVVSKIEKKSQRNNLYIGSPTVLSSHPRPVRRQASMRERVASYCGPGVGSFGGTGSFSTGDSGSYGGLGDSFGNAGGTVAQASAGNFYSPELSTDFLELPQSLVEQWNYYRFFYYNEPFVGRALDTHVQLPLSKIRFARPVAKNKELAEEALRYCQKWDHRISLSERLAEITFNYLLIGEVNIFCEDANPDMPDEVTKRMVSRITKDGEAVEEEVEYPDAEERAAKWMRKNYKGWTSIRVLPPEQVHIETFPFTSEIMIEVIPDARTKYVVEQADQGDMNAVRVAKSMDPAVIQAVRENRNIALNTDPYAGAFVYHMANKPAQYEPRGHSILQRCLRTLVYQDKLRQAQTQIASRHMTPVRLVYAENMNEQQVEDLRYQVDLALQDPDFSIITNFQVTWEEMNSNGRLLELSGEYDLIQRQLYAGLGVTESLLSGESSYSGDRINLEVLNTRYMALRDKLRNLVEKHILEPMCRRMGFVEEDEDGELVTVYPRFSFTRLAIRDNQEVFDALMQLYQKGSLDVETIYELMNLDPETVTERLQANFATLKDASMNDLIRGWFDGAGRKLGDHSELAEKIAEEFNIKYSPPPPEEGGRF